MRSIKESQVVAPSNLTLPLDRYQHVVEKGLCRLDEIERRAIFLRFWQPFTISQIADLMNLSWDEADRLIDQAVAKIRAVLIEKKSDRHLAGETP